VGPNYIALAVPFFFVLMGVELLVARRRKRAVYRFEDALTDLSCGVTQQIIVLFANGALFGIYLWIYNHARLVDLGQHSIAAWIVALVGVDFIYYWWHRTSHRVNLLWAAHAVHHQSEDYNLAVALRQAVLTPFTSLPFSLPLALLGIPPLVFVVADSVSTLYQFWIHTELVGRLGPLEAVLNTPSHHRVHHARNPEYIDRNYGAILIIWDRLFGTFAREDAKPVYGITKPFHSFNSLRAQLQPVIDVIATSLRAPRLAERLRVWLAPPERTFSWERATSSVPALDAAKFGVRVAPRLQRYIWINFGLVIAATFVLMMWSGSLPERKVVCGAMLILFALLSFGGLVEGRRWARPLELARVGITAVALVWLV
jgi:sterol desaturase/sphingolipid hydroxylase (fatty acid hydroxylase superfamily)